MDEDAIADLFAAFGPVAVRRMFGGAGLYADGLMFALWAGDSFYLKADAALAEDLKGRGSVPFSYVAKGVTRTMGGFWSVPEEALDDAEDLAALARRALFVAHAANEAKAKAKARPGGRASANKAKPAGGASAKKAKPAGGAPAKKPAAKKKSAPAQG
ncbi:DNA transformation protein [Xanthobacter sp. SG618]|uniref:TfoX/Sxy family protein n=1 Tax=Xanthobacter sp. SG618 TaxID=2587121 RepID=UPI00145F8609|nr:TfoX/Sxy family protein [Xanthobacter sp. SG618]NMN60219.1 DNA transformation protein [Xanthobacter sp. SG618]